MRARSCNSDRMGSARHRAERSRSPRPDRRSRTDRWRSRDSHERSRQHSRERSHAGSGCPRGARSLQVHPMSSSNQCSASLVGCRFGLICACLPGVWFRKSLWVIDWTAERCVLHAGIRATTWEIRNNPSVDTVWAQQALAALDWRPHCALEDLTRDGATTMASSRPPQRRRSPGRTRQRCTAAP